MSPLPLTCSRPFSETAAIARAGALFDLAKPRLAAMSVLSAMVAYATAAPALGPRHALLTALGTTLAAAGALSLNQWWERDIDATMARTRTRPLPQARLAPGLALTASIAWSITGVALLAAATNLLAADLAAATIIVYGLIYTPLKRRSRWATEIGAISGALPALLGNAAAERLLSGPGVALTAVLLLWQMPHFFAIGWRHRHDYRKAGFRLLPAIDDTGRRTACWSVGYALATWIASLAPWALGWVGALYGAAAFVAGAWFCRAAWRLLRDARERDARARQLFLTSIFYLPAVMSALVLDRALAT